MNDLINKIKKAEKAGTRIISFVYKNKQVRNVLIGSNRMKAGAWGKPYDNTRSIQRGDAGGLYLKGLANNVDTVGNERTYALDEISEVAGFDKKG